MNAGPYFGVIDIGNSGIKASLADAATKRLFGEVRSIHWRFPNDQQKSPPAEFQTRESSWASIDDFNAIGHMLDGFTSSLPFQKQSLQWQVSCVQPQALATLVQSFHSRSIVDTYRVIDFRDIPMEYQIDAPESVGIDRLLAARGAWQSSSKNRPLIVIQAGTAVTVDWVNEQGAYCGGAIMPGLSLTLKYLALGTAHLPWLAPPKDPNHVPLPGKNTPEAILAGVTASFIGGIEQLQRRYRKQYAGDPDDIETIVSGGDGLALSRAIAPPFKVVDHLVLNALAQIDKL